jgi:hypothetical protein
MSEGFQIDKIGIRGRQSLKLACQEGVNVAFQLTMEYIAAQTNPVSIFAVNPASSLTLPDISIRNGRARAKSSECRITVLVKHLRLLDDLLSP